MRRTQKTRRKNERMKEKSINRDRCFAPPSREKLTQPCPQPGPRLFDTWKGLGLAWWALSSPAQKGCTLISRGRAHTSSSLTQCSDSTSRNLNY